MATQDNLLDMNNDDFNCWTVQNIQSPSSSSSPPLSPNVEQDTLVDGFFARAEKELDDSLRNTGEISVCAGPMFSGKTTWLIGKIKQYKCARRKVVIIKHKKDDRYSQNEIMTHKRNPCEADDSISADGLQGRLCVTADFSVKYLTSLKVVEKCISADVIAIDEGQFFEDIVSFCEKMAEFGKFVFVATLDSNYLREDFGKSSELIRKADKKVLLTAVCCVRGCNKEAPFTKKRCNNGIETEVGGAELYSAVCRKHYLSSTK